MPASRGHGPILTEPEHVGIGITGATDTGQRTAANFDTGADWIGDPVVAGSVPPTGDVNPSRSILEGAPDPTDRGLHVPERPLLDPRSAGQKKPCILHLTFSVS